MHYIHFSLAEAKDIKQQMHLEVGLHLKKFREEQEAKILQDDDINKKATIKEP